MTPVLVGRWQDVIPGTYDPARAVVVTDPPYGLGADGGVGVRSPGSHMGLGRTGGHTRVQVEKGYADTIPWSRHVEEVLDLLPAKRHAIRGPATALIRRDFPAAALAASAPVAEGRLDFIAHAEHIRNEHDATHGEAEMCGAECIVMGLAADEWLDERLQEDGRKWRAAEAEGHVVTFTETGYGLMHPPSCRPDLIGCPYNAHLAGLNRPARKPGRYRMVRVRTRFTYAAAPCRLPHQRGQGDE